MKINNKLNEYNNKDKIINFKGIKFHNNCFDYIINKISKGGILVAPAASALAKIDIKKNYYNSLKESDVAILDSGLFCVLLRLFKKKKITKFSGYLFLYKFLKKNNLKKKKLLLINPTINESLKNKKLFKNNSFSNIFCYVAPYYTKSTIEDKELLIIINKYKPTFIIINLGGEIQEILAIYLKNKLNYKPSIICTGAAISFLTKEQAPINKIIDKFYLGWFWRIIYNPSKFFYRTLYSLNLIKLFIFK